MEAKNKKKIGLIAGIAVVLLAVIMVLVYMNFGPKTTEGSKTIGFTVIDADEKSQEFTLHTDAETLGEALLEEDLVAGEDSQYGLYVKEVNGIAVNDDNQEWWCFTKDGEMLNTGVDSTPIEDGDHYEATLTVGY